MCVSCNKGQKGASTAGGGCWRLEECLQSPTASLQVFPGIRLRRRRGDDRCRRPLHCRRLHHPGTTTCERSDPHPTCRFTDARQRPLAHIKSNGPRHCTSTEGAVRAACRPTAPCGEGSNSPHSPRADSGGPRLRLARRSPPRAPTHNTPGARTPGSGVPDHQPLTSKAQPFHRQQSPRLGTTHRQTDQAYRARHGRPGGARGGGGAAC